MNYEILKGKEIEIEGKKILVEEIEASKDIVGRTIFSINGSGQYSKFSVNMAIRLLENAENDKKKGLFGKLKDKFGIFFDKSIEAGVLLGDNLGIRKYGYNYCSIYFNITILERRFHFEFVWREKIEFTNARMPSNQPLKQLF